MKVEREGMLELGCDQVERNPGPIWQVCRSVIDASWRRPINWINTFYYESTF
jgi:hypothetical protein